MKSRNGSEKPQRRSRPISVWKSANNFFLFLKTAVYIKPKYLLSTYFLKSKTVQQHRYFLMRLKMSRYYITKNNVDGFFFFRT